MPNSAIILKFLKTSPLLSEQVNRQSGFFCRTRGPLGPNKFYLVPGVQALDYTNKRQNAEAAVGKKHLDSSLLLVQHLEGCLLLLDLPAHDHDDVGSGNESNMVLIGMIIMTCPTLSSSGMGSAPTTSWTCKSSLKVEMPFVWQQ